MKLSEIKTKLKELKYISFLLPNGEMVASHFHVTEVGKVSKHFIDCGGTVRKEDVANFQLWSSNDYDHKLEPKKLLDIIELSEKVLGLEDLEIEVEYQAETIGKFGLDFNGNSFTLQTKHTNCLAKDNCGIPTYKPKVKLSELRTTTNCTPESGCC